MNFVPVNKLLLSTPPPPSAAAHSVATQGRIIAKGPR